MSGRRHSTAADMVRPGCSRPATCERQALLREVDKRWKRKKTRGPSDTRAERGGHPARGGTIHGGVEANATRARLYGIATELQIAGRSRMTKEQLVEAIEKANAAATGKRS